MLVGVVAVALAGRAPGGSDGPGGAGEVAAPAGAVTTAASDPAAVLALEATANPAGDGGLSVHLATPSTTWRSDWPGAIAAAQRPAGQGSVNRFTIDDLRVAPSPFETTPPWVRRLGGLANYRVDPYER